MSVVLYIYKKNTGLFMYTDSGDPDLILYDLGEDKEFTLISPPDYDHQWRWIDDKWIADNTAN